MKKRGHCDRGPSKPEETIRFVCNRKEMGFAPLKLTVNKNEENILCASANQHKISIHDILHIVVVLKYLLKHNVNP